VEASPEADACGHDAHAHGRCPGRHGGPVGVGAAGCCPRRTLQL